MTMYIDRILAPIETLGPGKRLVIWTRGCTKHCKKCANPELWSTEGARDYPVDLIFNIVKKVCLKEQIEGITISGGDPLEQKKECLLLLQKLRPLCGDIIVYTGYTYAQLEKTWRTDELEILRRNVSVLIDGPYIDALNDDKVMLRGSTNQKLIFFDQTLIPVYEEYFSKGRTIQNVYMGDQLISVGIHNRREV